MFLVGLVVGFPGIPPVKLLAGDQLRELNKWVAFVLVSFFQHKQRRTPKLRAHDCGKSGVHG